MTLTSSCFRHPWSLCWMRLIHSGHQAFQFTAALRRQKHVVQILTQMTGGLTLQKASQLSKTVASLGLNLNGFSALEFVDLCQCRKSNGIHLNPSANGLFPFIAHCNHTCKPSTVINVYDKQPRTGTAHRTGNTGRRAAVFVLHQIVPASGTAAKGASQLQFHVCLVPMHQRHRHNKNIRLRSMQRKSPA